MRRTREEAQQTRQRILDAAEHCFYRFGVSTTTLERIAQHAGYSRGAVDWHFRGKRDILRAVIDRGSLSMQQRLQTVCDARPVLQALRACLHQVIYDVQSNPHLWAATVVLNLRCDFSGAAEGLLDKQLSLIECVQATLETILKQARLAGELTERHDERKLATLLGFGFAGALRQASMVQSAEPLERLTNAFDSLLNLSMSEAHSEPWGNSADKPL